MADLPDVRIGDFTFSYDESRSEMYVAKGEEAAAMLEVVSRERWEDFRQQATRAVDPEPTVTVQLESAEITTAESQQDVWEVSLAGVWGDCTVATSTSRAFAQAQAEFLTECLKITLGEQAVSLEHP